jgi:Protein of unknown function (DUF3617)
MKFYAARLLLLLLALPALALAAPKMKPGLWEETMAIEGDAAPASHKNCYSAKEVADVKKMLEARNTPNAPCRISDVAISSDGVTYKMACNMADGTSSAFDVSIDYRGDKYEGTMKSADGTATLTGKRLSACRK